MGRGRLAASHGIQQAISTPAPPKPAPPAKTYEKVDWQTHLDIMYEMEQDGSEGKGYVSTSRAYIINRYLRNGGDFKDALKASPDWAAWYTEAKARATIKLMDGQMKPLSRNIQGVRFVGSSFLANLNFPNATGIGAEALANILQTRIKFGNPVFTDKGYSSFSTNVGQNVFTDRPIQINYKISKGTKAIMTTNMVESEGILARGVQQRLTAARVKNGKLEIDVEV